MGFALKRPPRFVTRGVYMKIKLFVLTAVAAQMAWGSFDAEPTIREAYDHIIFKFFTPFQYKKKIAEIPEPFVAVHLESEGKRNDMRLLHHGAAAMYKRLEMMDRARQTIEMEYFIYSPNKKKPNSTETKYELSAKIINNKLIQKAIEGVQVRLLVDASATVWQFNDYYVTASKEAVKRAGGNPDKFQVRYYNQNSLTGKFSNFRSHRKLLVIDDQEAITGGRNVDDKYYDMDHKYNFLDRDIWIKGSIVIPMRASFDAFWNAGVTGKSKDVKAPLLGDDLIAKHNTLLAAAREFTVYTNHDRNVERKSRELGEQLYETSQTHSCPKTVYAADRPIDTVFTRWCVYGALCKGDGYKEDYRFTERAIGEYIRKLTPEDELIVDSPYFMLNTRSGAVLKYLTNQNMKLSVFTNSLGSTDAVYVASGWYREVSGLVKSGVKAFVHSSKAEPGYPVIDDNVAKARWGTHSKTQVFGDDAFFVGTYNVDNRSSFYNAEMGIICEGSKELTEDVKGNIKSRIKNAAYRIVDDSEAIDAQGNEVDRHGGASDKQKRLMESIRIPVEMLQFLM